MPVSSRIYAKAKGIVYRHAYRSKRQHRGMILRRRSIYRAIFARNYVRSIHGQRVIYRLAASMSRSRRYR
jgi:hypothetical protein